MTQAPLNLRQTRRLSALAAVVVALAAPAAAVAHPDLAGFWEPRDHSDVHPDPPALTSTAIANAKAEAATVKDGVIYSSRNCLAMGQPWTLLQSAPIDIIQDERETIMHYEGHSSPWHIYTDGRGHPDAQRLKLTVNGHSIGRWEADTFVVDTIGFSGKPEPMVEPGMPMTPTGHLTERFTLEPNGQVLHGRFTLEDPQTLTEPYSWDFVWFRSSPDTYAEDEVCDARNAANARY